MPSIRLFKAHLASAVLLLGCASTVKAQQARVVSIGDGDTIRVRQE